MKELPKYFVIKRDESNPLWKEFYSWFKKQVTSGIEPSDCFEYYGFDGAGAKTFHQDESWNGYNIENNIQNFSNSPTLITLEEWDECVNGFVLPEKWCVLRMKNSCFIINKWATSFFGNKIYPFNYSCSYGYVLSSGEAGRLQKNIDYTEITYEQFKKHVLKENNMEEKKQNRTITAKQAQSIIDIACSSWKPKLAEKWAVLIVQKKSIEITEDFYKEMRSACTEPQHKLFDEIFGKDEKEFTSDDLCDTETMVSGTFVFMRQNDRIINLNTGDSFSKNADEKVIGKKVVIKSIQWEEVK